jgi:uracil-DNA glycosylase family protein
MSEPTPTGTALDFIPPAADLEGLASAVQACRGCDLFRNATQAVFGAGAPGAGLLLVGEQPGDHEDVQGAPFVGPAGKVLQAALSDLGLARGDVYLTNAVKHFKWSPKGKRRIHETPRASEIRACRPWLEAEIRRVAPKLIVCLGATAARSVLGPSAKVTRDSGRVLNSEFGPALPTLHPSALLRIEEASQRQAAYAGFVDDLRTALQYARQRQAAVA